MEITKGIEMIDLALYIKKYKTLIISDTHIGFEEALNKQGYMVPRFHFPDLVKRIRPTLEKTKPETIIINGDIKHEFGKISEQEWRYTLRLIDLLAKNCKHLFLIRGNHDKSLGTIAEKRNIETADQMIMGDILITHGNERVSIPKNIRTIIIGHEHPAVSVKDNARKETFKCFLKGKYKNNTIIVQPSFNMVTEGTDVTGEKTISPYLKKSLKDFSCFIVADKIYDFGRLKNI